MGSAFQKHTCSVPQFVLCLAVVWGVLAWPIRGRTASGAAPASEADTQAALSARPLKWLVNTDRLAGNWGAVRATLEDRGVRFSLYYNHFYAYKNGGGLDRTGSGRHSGSVDLFGQVDFESMGIPGGEALIHVKNNWSENINRRVGALGDPIDDADDDLAIYINQLWYQQSSTGRKVQFRIGYLDQQTILDRNAYANSEDKQFMNTYLDNNSAIIPLAIGPGAAVFFNPTHWLSFVVTASDAEARPFRFSFDTAFDGDLEYFTYFETDLKLRLPSRGGPLVGNYRFGLFLDPRDRIVFGSSRTDRQNEGFYLSFDQMVYGETAGSDQGLGLFSRYGWRPGDVNRIEHFWSAGAQYKGLAPNRDQDVLGFGVYSAIGSDTYRDQINPDFDRETGYEVYYAVQLAPAIALTPALQYLRQPGALKSRRNVFVFALGARFRL